jgi:hypothetical protein
MVRAFAAIEYLLRLTDLRRRKGRRTARFAIVNTNPPTSDCATAGGTCQSNIVDYIVQKSGIDQSNRFEGLWR